MVTLNNESVMVMRSNGFSQQQAACSAALGLWPPCALPRTATWQRSALRGGQHSSQNRSR